MKVAIQKIVDEQVTGLKNKNTELLGKVKGYQDQLKQFDGIDVEETKRILEQHQKQQDGKLIDEGKIEELFSQRTERMKNDYDKRLKEAQVEVEKAKDFAGRFKARVLSDEFKSIARSMSVIGTAEDDVVTRAEKYFHVDEEGNVIPNDNIGLDSSGNVFTAKTWLESMKELAPHWFPVPKGGGAPGSDGGKAATSRSKMSSDEKLAYIQKHGQDAYLKLPK